MRNLLRCLAALTLATAGCSELPDIADGECGNAVLEPGEDCDSYVEPELGVGTQCAAADQANACHYVCGDGSGAACPTGWGCGADGMCRRASGKVDRAPGSPWRFPVDDFEIGDVDGDGNADLIGSADTRVTVRYGTETGEFPVDVDVVTRRPQGPAQFVDLDGDGMLDVVMPIFSGIFVMLGQLDRSLLPIAYQPFGFEAGVDISEIDLLPVEANSVDLDTELLTMFGTQQFFLVRGAEGNPSFFPGGHTVSDIVGRIPRGELDAPSLTPRQEWVLAFAGDDRVYVYTSVGVGPTLQPTLRQEVMLPAGTQVKFGVYFGNVDGDLAGGVGSQDLLISVTGGSRDAIAVAYNDGAGNLDAVATEESLFEALNPDVRPLAIADLNGDLRADYVSGDAILIADFALGALPGQPPRNLSPIAVRSTELSWTEAAIGDFNGDERLDVVTAVEAQDGLDFYLNTGLLFNKFHVNTDDPPFALRVGDYDGDFVGDLAFGMSGLGGKPDGIGVSFGATSGGPVEPVFMGEFEFIRRMEPINQIADIEAIDLISDMLVLSQEFPDRDTLSIAVLQGNSDRRLLSPFSLNVSEEDGGGADVPQQVLVGNFRTLLSNNDPRDIAALAQPPDNFAASDGAPGTGSASGVFRMWLVPSDGPGAQLSAQDTVYAPLPEQQDFEARCALWAAADLDGDGLDEVVGIDGSFRCYGKGASPPPRIVIANTALAEPTAAIHDLAGALRAASSMSASDMDGDGDADVLIVFGGEARSTSEGDVVRVDGSGVLVLWNADGTLDVGTPSELAILEAFSVFDAAPMHLVGDDEVPELVVLAKDAIYVATLDPVTKQYGAPERFLGQQGEGGRIGVGDVNGDGLDDVAWTEASDVQVWLGVSAPPLGGALIDTVAAPTEEGGQ